MQGRAGSPNKEAYRYDGPGFEYGILKRKCQSLVLISVYLDANEGLYSSNDAIIIVEEAAVVKTLERPWIGAGGWNLEPAELRDAEAFPLL